MYGCFTTLLRISLGENQKVAEKLAHKLRKNSPISCGKTFQKVAESFAYVLLAETVNDVAASLLLTEAHSSLFVNSMMYGIMISCVGHAKHT